MSGRSWALRRATHTLICCNRRHPALRRRRGSCPSKLVAKAPGAGRQCRVRSAHQTTPRRNEIRSRARSGPRRPGRRRTPTPLPRCPVAASAAAGPSCDRYVAETGGPRAFIAGAPSAAQHSMRRSCCAATCQVPLRAPQVPNGSPGGIARTSYPLKADVTPPDSRRTHQPSLTGAEMHCICGLRGWGAGTQTQRSAQTGRWHASPRCMPTPAPGTGGAAYKAGAARRLQTGRSAARLWCWPSAWAPERRQLLPQPHMQRAPAPLYKPRLYSRALAQLSHVDLTPLRGSYRQALHRPCAGSTSLARRRRRRKPHTAALGRPAQCEQAERCQGGNAHCRRRLLDLSPQLLQSCKLNDTARWGVAHCRPLSPDQPAAASEGMAGAGLCSFSSGLLKQLLRLQVVAKLGKHWHLCHKQLQGWLPACDPRLGQAAGGGGQGQAPAPPPPRPRRPRPSTAPPPTNLELAGALPCGSAHALQPLQDMVQRPTRPPCVRPPALYAPHATFYTLVSMGEAAWREDELRRLGYKVLASCCCGVGDHTLPGVQASLHSPRPPPARPPGERPPSDRVWQCPGGVGRPQNGAGRSCKRLARASKQGRPPPAAWRRPPSGPARRGPPVCLALSAPHAPATQAALRAEPPRGGLHSVLPTQTQQGAGTLALSGPQLPRYRPCVPRSLPPIAGLLLERATKLHADRQQGGDATTPTGVLCECGAAWEYAASYVTAVSGSTVAGMGLRAGRA